MGDKPPYQLIVPDADHMKKVEPVCAAFVKLNEVLCTNIDSGRRLSIVQTHLEQAYLMAVQAITHV